MEEQKRIDWEMTVRIEKIFCTVLHEAQERQAEKTTRLSPKGREATAGRRLTFRRNSLDIGPKVQNHLNFASTPY
jgi:hypothetical protein